MEKFKIFTGLKTPDGTVLHTAYRHDYKTHHDKNGKVYMIDGGGIEYTRHSGHEDEELIEVYSDEPFEKVRQYCFRNGYGKDMKGSFQTTFLKDMTDEHLKALLVYCTPDSIYLPIYRKEIEYRKENNIKIDEL